jgi:hypothetical protein
LAKYLQNGKFEHRKFIEGKGPFDNAAEYPQPVRQPGVHFKINLTSILSLANFDM